ncbi:type I restriction enzyme HsdR N-terminal domain-containing protein [Eggerthellaceae bacterium 24-137]
MNRYEQELLGGAAFLDRYETQLNLLCHNRQFIDIILSTSKEISEKTECDTSREAKQAISDICFRRKVYLLFPEYAYIVDDVAGNGYSKKSAVLSIYYATKILNPLAFKQGLPSSQEIRETEYDEQANPNPATSAARQNWEEMAFLTDKYRKAGASEREFQIEMENVFERLGWSRRLGEIISQHTIPVGSARSVRPDLIICKDHTPLFVVELKKPSAGTTTRNVDQLFSYMRLLRLNIGLLIANVIQLYYDDPSNADNPLLVESIPIEKSCTQGAALLNQLEKGIFSESNICPYIETRLAQQTIESQVRHLRSMLTSEKGAALVNEALSEFFHSDSAQKVIRHALQVHLQNNYAPEAVSQALEGLDIRWDSPSSTNVSPSRNHAPQRAPQDFYPSPIPDDEEPPRFRGKKVGQLANDDLRAVLESGTISLEEVRLMETKDYSKQVFGINYPLLVLANAPHDRSRYYVTPLFINGVAYKLCKEWFEAPANNDRPYLVKWLQSHLHLP